jgi:hypothetical protein
MNYDRQSSKYKSESLLERSEHGEKARKMSGERKVHGNYNALISGAYPPNGRHLY